VDLYIGKPHRYVGPNQLGYALSHEMNNEATIERYSKTNRLILDNGADELGEGEGGMRLAYLAGRLNPEFVILPDVLHKDKETRKRGIKFYTSMRDAGYDGKFISVIQAKTLDKGLESYKFWAKSGMVDRIGVTYDTKIVGHEDYALEFSWGKRISFLYKLAPLYEKYEIGIHMLGTLDVHEMYLLNHYDEFKKYGIYQMIESHDTTAPWACPTKFYAGTNRIHFDREKNWERLKFSRKFEPSKLGIAYWNVVCYLAACKIPLERWKEYIPENFVNHYWEDLEFRHYYE